MTLDDLEALIWSQVRNLAAADDLQRQTAMDAVRAAVTAYTGTVAGAGAATIERAVQAERRRILETETTAYDRSHRERITP